MRLFLALFFAAVSLPIGALIFLMVMTLARATWLAPIRRSVEMLTTSLPAFLFLFIPIALELSAIYPWASSTGQLDPQATDSIRHAHAWFAPAFFVARAYVYLMTWCLLAFALRSKSRNAYAISAVGLPIVLTTVSFAGFDWLMSVQPGWTSDAFGLYVAAGCFSGSMGALAVVLCFARSGENLARMAIDPDHVHAVGRVMLVAVMVWAYIGFCQFLLVWIGDLPSEIPFYADRNVGVWKTVSAILVTTHFVVPFLLLLSRPLKRRINLLAMVGALMLAAHFVDIIWITIPGSS